MDNESDMKTPYEVRPEGTSTSLNEIALLHRQSSGFYRQIASAMDGVDDTVGGYFQSLADYHDDMVEGVNKILEDMSGGVHTPSRTGETHLKKNEQALNRALQNKNTVELSELAHGNEVGISDAYQHAMANPNLIDFARDLLQKQHEKVLIWVNRADRYKTVPQQFNEHYDSQP